MALFVAVSVLLNFILTIVHRYPLIESRINNAKHPLSADCSAVKPSMEQTQALATLHRYGEPSRELLNLDERELIVERAGLVCKVYLDLETGKVKRTELLQPLNRWSDEGR
jgi:hypothetical protein